MILRISIELAAFSIENSTQKRPFQSKFAVCGEIYGRPFVPSNPPHTARRVISDRLVGCYSGDSRMLFVIFVTFMSGWQSSLIDVFFNVHLNNIGAPGILMGTTNRNGELFFEFSIENAEVIENFF